MFDGGYDEGYKAVPCFWGIKPGSLISKYLEDHVGEAAGQVLDLGCGEGKNAAAFAKAGFAVDAIDCSSAALANGRCCFANLGIQWHEADVRKIDFPKKQYDVVVAYGLFHCLNNLYEISSIVARAMAVTRTGGYHIICAFNDRSQDLSGHANIAPTLAGHNWYLQQYEGWAIISATDSILWETHPHNSIRHHHSLTRLMTRKCS
jgi:tellurite methyltransferase